MCIYTQHIILNIHIPYTHTVYTYLLYICVQSPHTCYQLLYYKDSSFSIPYTQYLSFHIQHIFIQMFMCIYIHIDIHIHIHIFTRILISIDAQPQCGLTERLYINRCKLQLQKNIHKQI